MLSLFTFTSGKLKRVLAGSAAIAMTALVTLGVFAQNGWLPKTDPLTGKKTGWFGQQLPKHHTNAWNPFPPPPPTPQLSKEYIYAGGRLLAVEDANAPTPVAESYTVEAVVVGDTLFIVWNSTRSRPAGADTLQIVDPSNPSNVLYSAQTGSGTDGSETVDLPVYLTYGSYIVRYLKNGTTELDSTTFQYN